MRARINSFATLLSTILASNNYIIHKRLQVVGATTSSSLRFERGGKHPFLNNKHQDHPFQQFLIMTLSVVSAEDSFKTEGLTFSSKQEEDDDEIRIVPEELYDIPKNASTLSGISVADSTKTEESLQVLHEEKETEQQIISRPEEEVTDDSTESSSSNNELLINGWRGGFTQVPSTVQKSIHNEREGEPNSDNNIHTHYVFLVHGWLGNSKEMSYLESSINHARESYTKSVFMKNNHDTRLITYSTIENDGKTTDGIANGGTRLAKEIQQFIKTDLTQNRNSLTLESDKKEHHVSISFVGNSLGGLYARYALSQIPTEIQLLVNNDTKGDKESPTKQQPIILHKELFITTATPHLGCSSHTFFGIPRALEKIIGRVLRMTGKDLFRVPNGNQKNNKNDSQDIDLIQEMCTDYESYLKPLTMFRKRVAYINAFQTDFQVPTSTAAFLNQDSTYSHSIRRCKEHDDDGESFIVAIANTKGNSDILAQKEDSKEEKESEDKIMSVKMDAIGWEKVFIDVREYIPGISLPFVKQSSREKWNNFIQSKVFDSKQSTATLEHSQKNAGGVVNVESRELYDLMMGSERLGVPVGHQVMIANSKNEMYSSFTKTGRPVMDHLAKQIVKSLYCVD
mmetsp:Transcript_26135/g.39553  ORF Transcript_26135/g.39553 Transcript_26135/m.39553 type:complete len:626 (+) Transcript_26135:48-1925(+)